MFKGNGCALQYRWWVVLALTFLNIGNQWQRYLINYEAAVSIPGCSAICWEVSFQTTCAVCPADDDGTCRACSRCRAAGGAELYNIVDGACLSESQYGVLTGMGFSAPFIIAGVLAGRIVDIYRGHIVRLLMAAGVGWSLTVVWQSSCQGYHCLLAARLLQAVLQAVNAPCCYALIAGFFSGAERATANGVYSLGMYLGYGMSSLTILMSLQVGWRQAMQDVGCLGVGLAAIVGFTVKRPAVVTDCGTISKANVGSAARGIFGDRLSLCLLAAASLRYTGAVLISSYAAIYYSRAFPDETSRFSVMNAIAVCVGGSVSSYLGGHLAAQCSRRRGCAMALIPAMGCGMAIPPLLGAFYSPNFGLSMACLFAAFLVGECWLGPAMAIVQNAVSEWHTGTAIAVYMFCMTLAAGFTPSIIGHLDPGTSQIRHTLAGGLALCYGGACVLFSQVACTMSRREAVQAAEAESEERQRLIPSKRPLVPARQPSLLSVQPHLIYV